jgi:hypothetical protein
MLSTPFVSPLEIPARSLVAVNLAILVAAVVADITLKILRLNKSNLNLSTLNTTLKKPRLSKLNKNKPLLIWLKTFSPLTLLLLKLPKSSKLKIVFFNK